MPNATYVLATVHRRIAEARAAAMGGMSLRLLHKLYKAHLGGRSGACTISVRKICRNQVNKKHDNSTGTGTRVPVSKDTWYRYRYWYPVPGTADLT